MVVVENARAGRARKRRKDSRYLEMAPPFLARMAAGESVRSICRDPEMAPWGMVQRWFRSEPDFAQAFAAARSAGGGVRRAGRPSGYDKVISGMICERLADGESLLRMCQEPGMPSRETVLRWLRRHEDFRRDYALAREAQGHLAADMVAEIIDEATPEAAHLARVKIDGLRWLAARLAPRSYGELKERLPEEERDREVIVAMRSFGHDGAEILVELTPEVKALEQGLYRREREIYEALHAQLTAAGHPDAAKVAEERAWYEAFGGRTRPAERGGPDWNPPLVRAGEPGFPVASEES